MTLLEVTDLTVSSPTADGEVKAVRGVSFSVDAGRTLGIVGESGSGKTILTQTLLGLTPGADISGSAVFEGTDLLRLSENDLPNVRGARIAVIFQDPLTSLHPLYKIGWQIAEMIQAHDKSVSKKEASERAVDLLRRVGIPRPKTRVNDYPHQFSGGMRQRVDRCLTGEPSLRPLGLDAYHSSACWLPVKAAGLSEQAEELRAQMVREGRGEAAAEVFEAEVAGAFASDGSVAG